MNARAFRLMFVVAALVACGSMVGGGSGPVPGRLAYAQDPKPEPDPQPPPAPALGISVPPTVQGVVGRYVRIEATTTGKTVQWFVADPDSLDLFPPELMRDTRIAVVTPQRAGKFRVVAYTAYGDEPSAPAVCVVEVVAPTPPVPPVPPTPPTPPAPADPLIAPITAAFRGESSPTRQTEMSALVDFYAAASNLSFDPSYKTWGELWDAMVARAAEAGATGTLPTVKQALLPCFSALPTSRSVPLDAAGRATVAAAMRRASFVLEAASP